MTRKYAIEYVDRLLAGTTYDELVQLSSAICSSPSFKAAAPDYALPPFAFVFVETLVWIAQALRSGVWTYYEATPASRQTAMAAALRAQAPDGFATEYESGMAGWREEDRVSAVDEWIIAHEVAATAWLRNLLRANRDALHDLVY